MELPFSTHLSHAHGAAGVVDLGGVVVCTVVGSGVLVACSVVVSGVVLDCSVVGSGVVVPCSVVVWAGVVVWTQSQSMPNNLQSSIELPNSTHLSHAHGVAGVVDLGVVVVCTVVGSGAVVPCSVVVWDGVVVRTQSQSMPNDSQSSMGLPFSTHLSHAHGAAGVVDLGGVVVCTVVGSGVVVACSVVVSGVVLDCSVVGSGVVLPC